MSELDDEELKSTRILNGADKDEVSMEEEIKIYFKCPKCKKIIERSKDNPFIKWRFLHLFCESFCEKHGEKVLMRRVLWKKK